MDHNEAIRKFGHLLEREAEHAREAAIELEALVSFLPSENSRQLAQLQVKASHKQAKELRELAQKVKES
jgi:hypothetical protein